MASKIKIYKGNPTSGLTDGDLVSSDTGLSPIESGLIKVPSDGYQEGSAVKLAARCDDGYKTIEDGGVHATITIVDSDHVDKWALAPDDGGSPGVFEDWGDPLTFLAEIGDTNTIFWIKARVASTEEPVNDASIDIQIVAVIGVE
jgi:hypothetical protein